jgi:hypothetical protein
MQRQYEALRTYFVDKIPSDTVARNFGYTPGSFRQLCHQFKHEWDNQKHFFASIKRGPQAAPKRDKVRDTVISLRSMKEESIGL